MPVTIYENYLKSAYKVIFGDGLLIIDEKSCYRVSGETGFLIDELPESGSEETYLKFMAGIGLNQPSEIFHRLVQISLLRKKTKHGLRDVVNLILRPRIPLVSSDIQHKTLSLTGFADKIPSGRFINLISILGAIGILLTSSLVASHYRALPVPTGTGGYDWLWCSLLVLSGSIVHELGHSFMMASSGMGFRPIGLSAYLVFPVLYTNVSGIEKLPIYKKILVNSGGFIFQGIYLLVLIILAATTGKYLFVEAIKWTCVLLFFNLNPFFRTDGYWVYKDIYVEYSARKLAKVIHCCYLLLFMVVSGYFLWRVAQHAGYIWYGLKMLVTFPDYFFLGGYKMILGAYLLFIGVSGGLQRFREGYAEWTELRGIQ